MAKVLEKIQLKLNNDNIKKNQHAFSEGRSTVSALAISSKTGLTLLTIPETEEKAFTRSFVTLQS
jgi:hypothetical protein